MPTLRLLVSLAALTLCVACDPGWTFRVEVTDEAGPVAGAAVGAVCSGPTDGHPGGPLSGWFETTGADGVALASGTGYGLALPCRLTVAHPGHVTVELDLAERCAATLDRNAVPGCGSAGPELLACQQVDLAVVLASEPSTP